MPQERISTKIWERPAALDRVAFRGEKEIWAQGIELHGDFKPRHKGGHPIFLLSREKLSFKKIRSYNASRIWATQIHEAF
jgi:hypothetical protein